MRGLILAEVLAAMSMGDVADPPWGPLYPLAMGPSVHALCLLQRNGIKTLQRAAEVGTAVLALRLELHLPFSLSEIHQGELGPLPKFVKTLQAEMCQAVALPPKRFSFLSIRGDYMTFNASMAQNADLVNAMLLSAGTVRKGRWAIVRSGGTDPTLAHLARPSSGLDPPAAIANASSVEHEAPARRDSTGSIIDLEVLPGELISEPTPWMVLALWQEQLEDKDSELMSGRLAKMLDRASLLVGTTVGVVPIEYSYAGHRRSLQAVMLVLLFRLF